MKKSITFWIVVPLIILIVVFYAMSFALNMFQVNIIQPIQFNHKLHVDKDGDVGMECEECHQYYKTQKNSGRPTLEICMGCHEDEESDNPELKKLMMHNKQNKEILWQRIYYLPDHVYFSHRMHTQVVEIECETCHGKVEDQNTPPSRPLVLHTMDFCMDCHDETQASLDCLTCHQ